MSVGATLFSFLALETLNTLLLQPFLEKQTNSESDMKLLEFTVQNLGILIAIGFAIYLLVKFYRWHRQDERLKRDDLVQTIRSIQEAQINYCDEALRVHEVALKKELNSFKEILKENGVDKDSLAKFSFKVQGRFDNYEGKDSNGQSIDYLLRHLDKHTSDEILPVIRAKNTLKTDNQ